jgi:predicted PurR-regulated permease PerM
MTAKTALQVLEPAAGAWLVVQTWQLLLIVFLALTVAAAMLPAIEWAQARRLPRSLSVGAIYLAVLCFFIALAVTVVPVVVARGRRFSEQARAYSAAIQAWFGPLQGWAPDHAITLEMPQGESLTRLGQEVVRRTFDVTAGVVGAVFGGIVVFFLAALFVIDGPHLWEGVVALVPATWQPAARELGRPVLNRMGSCVRGQLFSSLCVGTVIAVAC